MVKIMRINLFLCITALCCCCNVVLCQSNIIRLKYKIENIEIEDAHFPVKKNGNLTKFVDHEQLIDDTLIVFLKGSLEIQHVDTLQDGVIAKSGIRLRQYHYRSQRFSHYLNIKYNLEDVKFIKLFFEEAAYLFEKKRANLYLLK